MHLLFLRTKPSPLGDEFSLAKHELQLQRHFAGRTERGSSGTRHAGLRNPIFHVKGGELSEDRKKREGPRPGNAINTKHVEDVATERAYEGISAAAILTWLVLLSL